jgi:hypothetical protein
MLGFSLGAVGSYIGLYWKVKKELEALYDKDLRTKRLNAYTELWKLLQPLAKYSWPIPVTAASLENLSADLRKWFFEVGGLFLSERTRKEYFALQNALTIKIANCKEHLDRELSDADFLAIRTKGSQLRTSTTVDVGSRKRPLIPDEASASSSVLLTTTIRHHKTGDKR